MKNTSNHLLATILLVIIPSLWLSAQTSHGWRGPERSGYYNETGLMKIWPEEGPELLWETMDVGKGYSSPVIVEDKLYITGMNQDGSKETLMAYDMKGNKIYEVEYGSPWDNTYPETRTTPTIVGDTVYVISGSGEIVCMHAANGDVIWKVDGATTFESSENRWGTAESPLVFDNKVIFTPAGDLTTMVALNAETGETVWKTKSLGDPGCYVSPLLITYNGKKKIISATGKSVFGVDPQTGTIEWTFSDWGDPERANIATNTALYNNGRIFFSFGYDIGSFMLQLNDEGNDASLVWRNDTLDTHIGGYVLADGIIYGSNWINNSQGNWVAVDWESGKTLYEETWTGKSKGSVIAADDMLYCFEERRGMVGLVNVNPEKFDVVSEFRITQGDGPYWAHPVINNGILYIRHGSALMAYKIR